VSRWWLQAALPRFQAITSEGVVPAIRTLADDFVGCVGLYL
jgi:hypothetical protein